MNINDFVMLVKNQRNPQQMIMTMLETQSAQNPMLGNLLQLAQRKDSRGIEQFARNVMKERGLDFDTEFNNFRKTFSL